MTVDEWITAVLSDARLAFLAREVAKASALAAGERDDRHHLRWLRADGTRP